MLAIPVTRVDTPPRGRSAALAKGLLDTILPPLLDLPEN